MSAWYEEDMPLFDPPDTHPGWAGQSPTPTLPVVWFALSPHESWSAFRFQYSGEIVHVRTRRCAGLFEVDVWMRAVDMTLVGEGDDLWIHSLLSLWMNAAGAHTGESRPDAGPLLTHYYRITEDLRLRASHGIATENVLLGIFIGDDESAGQR